MNKYSVKLKLPQNNVESFLEAIRGIGAADEVTFVIESDSRREAVRDTLEILTEFAATYQGSYLDGDAEENVKENLLRISSPKE